MKLQNFYTVTMSSKEQYLFGQDKIDGLLNSQSQLVKLTNDNGTFTIINKAHIITIDYNEKATIQNKNTVLISLFGPFPDDGQEREEWREKAKKYINDQKFELGTTWKNT